VRAFVALGLIVFLSGCGASEQQRVAATLRASDAAFERGDLDDGCSWLTERARRRFMADGINPRARTCDQAYTAPTTIMPTEGTVIVETLSAVDDPEAPRMTDIQIDGDRAVARYSNGGRTRLQKVHGRWLIDSY
jgi:hypothetical protein